MNANKLLKYIFAGAFMYASSGWASASYNKFYTGYQLPKHALAYVAQYLNDSADTRNLAHSQKYNREALLIQKQSILCKSIEMVDDVLSDIENGTTPNITTLSIKDFSFIDGVLTTIKTRNVRNLRFLYIASVDKTMSIDECKGFLQFLRQWVKVNKQKLLLTYNENSGSQEICYINKSDVCCTANDIDHELIYCDKNVNTLSIKWDILLPYAIKKLSNNRYPNIKWIYIESTNSFNSVLENGELEIVNEY